MERKLQGGAFEDAGSLGSDTNEHQVISKRDKAERTRMD